MTTTFEPINELYSSLSAGLRQELEKIAETRSVEPGGKLLRLGERPAHIFILNSGKVEITVPAEGKLLPLGTDGPGSVLGLRAIIAGEAGSVDVTALEKCAVTLLPAEEFLDILRRNPEMYMAVVKVLTGDLRRADSFLRQKATNSGLASSSRPKS